MTTRAGTSGRHGKLVGAGAQHRAQYRLDALERPAAAQAPRRSAGRAGVCSRTTPPTMSRKNAASAGRYCVALDFAAEPMVFELGHDLVQAGAGEIHLVERLHGGEPRGAALVGLARLVVSVRRAIAQRFSEPALERDQRQRRARGVAAFVLLFHARAGQGLRLVLDGDDAVADRQSARQRKLHQAARRLMRDDLEMDGLAADDAAERDGAVIGRRLRCAASTAMAIAVGISSEPGTLMRSTSACASSSAAWRQPRARRRSRHKSAPQR